MTTWLSMSLVLVSIAALAMAYWAHRRHRHQQAKARAVRRSNLKWLAAQSQFLDIQRRAANN